MPTLNLKPTDRRIKAYYDELQRLERLGATNETAVRLPFQTLLEYCGQQSDLTLRLEYPMKGAGVAISSSLMPHYSTNTTCYTATASRKTPTTTSPPK